MKCGIPLHDAFGSTGALKYKPNPYGPKEYFIELDNYRRQAMYLKMAPIHFKTAMSSALFAFSKCGHKADKIRSIEEEWRLKEMQYTNPMDGECYNDFKKFYIQKLKHLYTGRSISSKQTKARANYTYTGDEDSNKDVAVEMKQIVCALQAHQANLMDAVSTALQNLELNQAPPTSAEVPSIAGTAGSTMSGTKYTAYQTAKDENRRLTKELASRCPKVPRNQGNGKNRKNERWQMNQYCSTYGVNTSHGSS